MVVDLERETGISVGGEDLGNGVDVGSSSEEKKSIMKTNYFLIRENGQSFFF